MIVVLFWKEKWDQNKDGCKTGRGLICIKWWLLPVSSSFAYGSPFGSPPLPPLSPFSIADKWTGSCVSHTHTHTHTLLHTGVCLGKARACTATHLTTALEYAKRNNSNNSSTWTTQWARLGSWFFSQLWWRFNYPRSATATTTENNYGNNNM